MRRLFPLILVASSLLACHSERERVLIRSDALPSASAAARPSAVLAEELHLDVLPPVTVERVAVVKDSPASVVRAPRGSTARIVFMPGLCSNAYAYLLAFPETARTHGGVVAIDGDAPCGAADSGFHSFTWSATLQKSRIDAALAAASANAPSDGFTLVGYSAGASIAQMVHERWPKVFPRLVIIAPPEDPTVERLTKARGVVSMSCRFDVPYRMKDATNRLNAKGIPAIYLEMPGCTHGNIADGERVFTEAFEWLDGAPISEP